jgi:hypothetical protein
LTSSEVAPRAQALSSLVDAAKKPRIVFASVIDPIILGPEADQYPGQFSVADNYDLLIFSFTQKPREIVLDLGQRSPA